MVRSRSTSSASCGVGDMLELRGPIGGYFVWEARSGGPLLLVAGGSGIVPLMSMLRHRQASDATDGARLIYSSRSWDEVIYRDELERLAAASNGPEVIHTLTRMPAAGMDGLRSPGRRGDARRVRRGRPPACR